MRILDMIFPSRRQRRAGIRAARNHLAYVKAKNPEIEALIEESKEYRRRNNFAQMFAEALGQK